MKFRKLIAGVVTAFVISGFISDTSGKLPISLVPTVYAAEAAANTGELYDLTRSDITSFSTYCYDKAIGGGIDVSAESDEELSKIWDALNGLTLGEKASDNVSLYFDAMGISKDEPMQFFSLTLADGREVTAMLVYTLSGEKYIQLNIHSKDEAGQLFFMYDYEDIYRCDHTPLTDTVISMFTEGGISADDISQGTAMSAENPVTSVSLSAFPVIPLLAAFVFKKGKRR